jgi:hypothetical protein
MLNLLALLNLRALSGQRPGVEEAYIWRKSFSTSFNRRYCLCSSFFLISSKAIGFLISLSVGLHPYEGLQSGEPTILWEELPTGLLYKIRADDEVAAFMSAKSPKRPSSILFVLEVEQ